MNVSENNLRFEYLYRDAGNYKQFGQLIFTNPSELQPEEAAEKLKHYLIDGEFFAPDKVQISDLKVFEFDSDIDHEWCEFQKFTFVNEMPTDTRTAEMFIESFA